MKFILFSNHDNKNITLTKLPSDILEQIYVGKFKVKDNDTKVEISKINHVIPLYYIYTESFYLIHPENLYQRIFYESYRPPSMELMDYLKEQKNIKAVEFLENFDLKVLEENFIQTLYHSSNQLGKNLTVCRRPSFHPLYRHIKPYYNRDEIINLALNMVLIKPDRTFYDRKLLGNLCQQVKVNDISANTLLKHTSYIIDKKSIGLVQYYTLQGSYFMNKYLRNINGTEVKNELLEQNIIKMWRLISESPKFDKSYIVYRFVESDDYLVHLKIGDEYVEDGFMSTTRDPFYRSEHYKFGFILIKIRLPANQTGVGLCVESFSHFQPEQEIVLPPKSKFRLTSRDDNCSYFHIDRNYETKIKTRYEFEYLGSEGDEITKVYRPLEHQNKLINFMELKLTGETLLEKINNFTSNYLNEIYQFDVNINSHRITLITEWFESNKVYEQFYAIKNRVNTFSIYTLYKNSIALYLEFDTDNNIIIVNYYFRYSDSTVTQKLLGDSELLAFLAKLGYAFEVEKIVIYSNYLMCYHSNVSEIGRYNYNADIYNYLKNKSKRFANVSEITPSFHYYQLDKLFQNKPATILNKLDTDEIYMLYQTNKKSIKTIRDLYMYLIEKHCHLTSSLINKMERLYTTENPFSNDYYILNSFNYLYNRRQISVIPRAISKVMIAPEYPNKNRYRLNYDRRY